MTTYGPWRTDSIPLEDGLAAYADTATSETMWGWRSLSGTPYSGTPAERIATAWTLAGTVNTGAFQASEFGTGEGVGRWGITWMTATVADTTRTGPGNLPLDAITDPRRIGVEWEEVQHPIGYRVNVAMAHADFGPAYLEGRPLPVKVERDFGSYYTPSPEVATVTNARPTAASINLGTSLNIDLPDQGLVAGESFAVAVVDPWTATQTIAPFDEVGDTTQFGWIVQVVPIYRPAFRLILSGRNRPHLRQYPRSPLRHWPPERSVQRSLRQGPGAFK